MNSGFRALNSACCFLPSSGPTVCFRFCRDGAGAFATIASKSLSSRAGSDHSPAVSWRHGGRNWALDPHDDKYSGSTRCQDPKGAFLFEVRWPRLHPTHDQFSGCILYGALIAQVCGRQSFLNCTELYLSTNKTLKQSRFAEFRYS